MVGFDSIGSLNAKISCDTICNGTYEATNLFSNHIHDILNPAVWDEREDARVDDTQILHAMHSEAWIDDSLVDVLTQPVRTAWVESCLTSL